MRVQPFQHLYDHIRGTDNRLFQALNRMHAAVQMINELEKPKEETKPPSTPPAVDYGPDPIFEFNEATMFMIPTVDTDVLSIQHLTAPGWWDIDGRIWVDLPHDVEYTITLWVDGALVASSYPSGVYSTQPGSHIRMEGSLRAPYLSLSGTDPVYLRIRANTLNPYTAVYKSQLMAVWLKPA